eukprot:5201939-Prymnesium_polylepis.1
MRIARWMVDATDQYDGDRFFTKVRGALAPQPTTSPLAPYSDDLAPHLKPATRKPRPHPKAPKWNRDTLTCRPNPSS